MWKSYQGNIVLFSLQDTAVLGTSHIMRKVTKCDLGITVGSRGEVRCMARDKMVMMVMMMMMMIKLVY